MKAKFLISTALAVCALGATSASAFASTTVHHPGTHTVTATTNTVLSTSTSTVTCTSSSLQGDIGSGGAISNVTSVNFGGCTTLIFGSPSSVTVTANNLAGWGGQLTWNNAGPDGVAQTADDDISFDLTGVDTTLVAGGGACSFDVTGSVNGGTYNNGTTEAVMTNATGLSISNVSGFCPVSNGQSATFTATYDTDLPTNDVSS